MAIISLWFIKSYRIEIDSCYIEIKRVCFGVFWSTDNFIPTIGVDLLQVIVLVSIIDLNN